MAKKTILGEAISTHAQHKFNEFMKDLPKYKHIGGKISKSRLNDVQFSSLERAFVKKWNELDRYGQHTLDHLVNQDEIGASYTTDRDMKVAGAVVQWLGTNCGFAFLSDVLREHGQYELLTTQAYEKRRKRSLQYWQRYNKRRDKEYIDSLEPEKRLAEIAKKGKEFRRLDI